MSTTDITTDNTEEWNEGLAQEQPASGKNRRWPKVVALVSCGMLLSGVPLGIALSSAQQENEALQDDLAGVQSDLAATEGDLAGVQSDLDEYKDQEAALAARESALDEREAGLDGREAGLDERETAIQQTEAQIDASKINPGTYLVPEELTAGRYRPIADVTGSCYMAQKRGDDIVDNLLEREGRPVFTVVNAPGTTFIIDGDCGVVQKID